MTHKAEQVRETAESASDKALSAVFSALGDRKNFKLEAGAGAGKTYSLVKALKHVLDERERYLPRGDQRVACLTYTKVARDEIRTRTDEDPSVFAETLHGFLWEMIGPHQKALATALRNSDAWTELLADIETFDSLRIEYDQGFRGVHDDRITLHHDDIPALAIALFDLKKFRALVADRFPVIFIDEYQDTPAGLVEAMLSGHETDTHAPIVGLFGDHWQQIYDHTCGSISHPSVTSIPKNANFRSDKAIVDFLNRLRPELPQAPRADAREGLVTVYHTNSWPGVRLSRNWKGQISHEATQACLAWLRSKSASRVWLQDSKNLKVLMLTHATIANELGYPSLPGIFRHNEAFAKMEDVVVEYLVGSIEPALDAFRSGRYGELFDALGSQTPMLRAPGDKATWTDFFKQLEYVGVKGTVGDVLHAITSQSLFSVPTRVTKREDDLRDALTDLDEGERLTEPRRLVEHSALREVPYLEIRALRGYLSGATEFATKHSVKGAEFDDIVVQLGRGWTQYDFAKMLSAHVTNGDAALKEANTFEKSRNLFYVAASRAKRNLALLFVQELDADALATLREWVGSANVVSIEFDDSGAPK